MFRSSGKNHCQCSEYWSPQSFDLHNYHLREVCNLSQVLMKICKIECNEFSYFIFHAALETLVEIANLRSTMLSMFEQVHKELENTNG